MPVAVGSRAGGAFITLIGGTAAHDSIAIFAHDKFSHIFLESEFVDRRVRRAPRGQPQPQPERTLEHVAKDLRTRPSAQEDVYMELEILIRLSERLLDREPRQARGTCKPCTWRLEMSDV